MKASSFLLTILLVVVPLTWGQSATSTSSSQSSSGTQAGSTQTTAPGPRAARRERMRAMSKEHLEAMKSEVQKMHSAFDRMKSNVAAIANADEKERWQANLDMWEIVVQHHDQMLKHMEDAQASGMGCGMMMGDMGMGGGMMGHHGMGPMNAPPTPPPATKPQ